MLQRGAAGLSDQKASQGGRGRTLFEQTACRHVQLQRKEAFKSSHTSKPNLLQAQLHQSSAIFSLATRSRNVGTRKAREGVKPSTTAGSHFRFFRVLGSSCVRSSCVESNQLTMTHSRNGKLCHSFQPKAKTQHLLQHKRTTGAKPLRLSPFLASKLMTSTLPNSLVTASPSLPPRKQELCEDRAAHLMAPRSVAAQPLAGLCCTERLVSGNTFPGMPVAKRKALEAAGYMMPARARS